MRRSELDAACCQVLIQLDAQALTLGQGRAASNFQLVGLDLCPNAGNQRFVGVLFCIGSRSRAAHGGGFLEQQILLRFQGVGVFLAHNDPGLIQPDQLGHVLEIGRWNARLLQSECVCGLFIFFALLVVAFAPLSACNDARVDLGIVALCEFVFLGLRSLQLLNERREARHLGLVIDVAAHLIAARLQGSELFFRLFEGVTGFNGCIAERL